jgi:hypothetical protein
MMVGGRTRDFAFGRAPRRGGVSATLLGLVFFLLLAPAISGAPRAPDATAQAGSQHAVPEISSYHPLPSAPLVARESLPVPACPSQAEGVPRGVGCLSLEAGAVGGARAAAPVAAPTGPSWQNLNLTHAPTPRVDSQMAYDASDGYVVLYGGTNATTLPPICQNRCSVSFAETWILRGAHWTQLSIPSPPGRQGARMVYDAADGYVLLFGGQLWCDTPPCAIVSDAWAFHDGHWKLLPTPAGGPVPRLDPALTYDTADGYVLMFGGILASGPVANDTWRFSSGTWTRLPGPAPPASPYTDSMTYDAADGYVVLLGTVSPGQAGISAGVTWIFARGVWSAITPYQSPPFLWGAWLAYDPAVAYVVLLGEQVAPLGQALYNVTWGYLEGNWFPIASPNPSLRLGISTMTYDPADGWLLAFGGEQWPNGTLPSKLLNDTWAFSSPPLVFESSVTANPSGVCPQTVLDCPAGTNITRVTLRLEPVYAPAGTNTSPAAGFAFPLVLGPTFQFVPWGSVQLPANLSRVFPTVSCSDPEGFTGLCDRSTTFVRQPNGLWGLSWRWSLDPNRDQMLVRAKWSASFYVTVVAPPFGFVPIDSCTTPECTTAGSESVGKNYTWVSFSPFANRTILRPSFPLGGVTVEAPSPPIPPPQTGLPPPPPPPPTGPPGGLPVIVPPGPGPTVTAPGGGPGLPALAPVAAGALAAGFTRIPVKRKLSMAVAAVSGAPITEAEKKRRAATRGKRTPTAPAPPKSRFE